MDAEQKHPRVIALPEARLGLTDRLRRKLDMEGWLARSMSERSAHTIRSAVYLPRVGVGRHDDAARLRLRMFRI